MRINPKVEIRINKYLSDMKKVIMYFMLLLSIGIKAQTTIVNKFGTHKINTDVVIYKDGETVAKFYSKDEISLTGLKPDTYTYKSKTNHVGSIDTRKNTILELNCAKLEIQILDTQNNPIINTEFNIFEDGDLIQSDYTDNEGKCFFYLKPSIKYAYTNKYSSGNIEIPNGKEGSLIVLTINDINNLQVTAKYKDLPIYDYFTLYPYNDKEHPLSSTTYTSNDSGKMTFYVDAKKSYWIKTKYGTFSEPFTMTEYNSEFYLEHYKVTFISNSTDPNILEEFKVSGINSSSSKKTDGKGHVEFYLIPGTYSYSHINGSGTFTINKSDTIIDLASNKQTITFTDYSGKPYNGLHIKISDQKNSYGIIKEYVTNEYGQIHIIRSGNSSMYLGIEDYISDFQIHTTQDTVMQLTKCTFKSNLADDDYIYLSGKNSNTRINSGESILLLPGNYTYRYYHEDTAISYYKQLHVQSNVNNIDINDDLNKLTVYKHSKDGSISSYNNTIFLSGNDLALTSTLDENGYCVFYVPSDTYLIKDSFQKQDTVIDVNKDTFIEIITPNNININITDNGIPYNGSVYFSQDLGAWNITATCKNGKLSVPIEEGESYFIMLSGVYNINYSKAVLYNNTELNFTDIKIQSEGSGLTFPLNATQEPLPQKYLIGSTIKLCGVPMEGYRCAYWEINGMIYNSDIIELQIDSKTTATAYFTSDISTNVSENNVSNIDIDISNNHIYFPQKIKGNVYIYNANGALAKRSFVISDQMDIDDLPPGFYILSVKTEEGLFSTKFSVKE